MTDDDTRLRPSDLATSCWMRLKRHYTLRLDELRRQNDSPALGKKKTAEVRGQILEVQKFLALEAEALNALKPPAPPMELD